jgi:hypothetical protein
MNDLKQNEQMEILLRAKKEQPSLFAQLPATTKIALGIYESTKTATANGLTADEHLRLRGLKLSLAKDNLAPQERTFLALEIQNFEKKLIGENK